jgi:hypothetical protein
MALNVVALIANYAYRGNVNPLVFQRDYIYIPAIVGIIG